MDPGVVGVGAGGRFQLLACAGHVAAAGEHQRQVSPRLARLGIGLDRAAELLFRHVQASVHQRPIAAFEVRTRADGEGLQALDQAIGRRHLARPLLLEVNSRVVRTIEPAQRQAEGMVDDPGLRLQLESLLEVFRGLRVVTFRRRGSPEAEVGGGGEALVGEQGPEVIARRGRVAESEPHVAETPSRRQVVALLGEGALEADGGGLQVPRRLVQGAQVVGPEEAARIESLGVAVAGRGGLQQLVGVVELAHAAESTGQLAAARSPGQPRLEPRALLLELLAGDLLDGVEPRVGDVLEIERQRRFPGAAGREEDRGDETREQPHAGRERSAAPAPQGEAADLAAERGEVDLDGESGLG